MAVVAVVTFFATVAIRRSRRKSGAITGAENALEPVSEKPAKIKTLKQIKPAKALPVKVDLYDDKDDINFDEFLEKFYKKQESVGKRTSAKKAPAKTSAAKKAAPKKKAPVKKTAAKKAVAKKKPARKSK